MSYLVHVTSEAEEDLRGVYLYIAFELLSPKNAKRKTDKIKNALKSLEKFPMRYRLVKDEYWNAKGMRVFPCENFLIFYLVKEEKNEVTISRIIYGKRNLEEINLSNYNDEN